MPIETTKESPAPVSGEWVMVPREPTAEMVSAAYAAHQAVGLPGVAYRAMLAAAPAPATGGVTEGMVDMALDAADYIPNEDNRKWMSLALAAALRSRPTVSPPPVPGEVEALRNALIAVRPIVNSLIEREHNIEWWGLRQRLAAIDAALRASPPASPTEAGEATTSLPDPALTDAIEWLETNQRQLDQDGIEVAVSRQALEQILAALKDRSHV